MECRNFIEEPMFIALFISLPNDIKSIKIVDQEWQNIFSCKRENTLKSMEFSKVTNTFVTFCGYNPTSSSPVAERLITRSSTPHWPHVLLAGVPGGYSRGSPVFAHPLIGH